MDECALADENPMKRWENSRCSGYTKFVVSSMQVANYRDSDSVATACGTAHVRHERRLW